MCRTQALVAMPMGQGAWEACAEAPQVGPRLVPGQGRGHQRCIVEGRNGLVQHDADSAACDTGSAAWLKGCRLMQKARHMMHAVRHMM